MTDRQSTPAERVSRLIWSYWTSQAIHVAAELGIADLVAEAPRTPAELARATAADADALTRVLRLLASEGIFAETADGAFEQTPMSETLKGGAAEWLRARFIVRPANWRAAGQMLEGVRTGAVPFEIANGAPLFEQLRANPTEAELFDRLMMANTLPVARAVAGAYDFAGVRTVIDVGGGRGALAIEILNAHPGLHGIVFDQPHVVPETEREIAKHGLATRCSAAGGDFFEAVPEGADAYLLKFILHDWDDGRSSAILERCAAAMATGGRVLVIENVLPEDNRQSFARIQDINMLVNLGGRERTKAEFASLFETAGLELQRAIPVAGDIHVIEGAKRSSTN